MRWIRRGILLTLGLAFLTGCSAGKASGTESTGSGQESGADGLVKESESLQGAKGRYMETEIEFPKEIQEFDMASVIQRDDKSLEFLLFNSEKGSVHYLYDGEAFTEVAKPPVFPGISASSMILGEDGVYYFGGYDSEWEFHLWREKAGEAEEVFSEVFRIPEGKEYGIIPDYLAVLQDGSLLVSKSQEAKVIRPDGKEAFTLRQEFIGTDIRIPAMVSDNTYFTIMGKKLARYDLSTGGEIESYEIPEKKSGDWPAMAFSPDGEGGIYAACTSGLYHIGKNGTLWEQLIDGSLNSMGRQDIFLRGFFAGGNQEFYGVYTGNGKLRLFRYDYDETADAVPPNTLTVYSLRDNPTVRQAAAILQKNNPDIRVEFRIALQGEEEEATEDMLRALNTELLNKKGADILILDGLPVEAYEEKGILADMKSLYEEEKKNLLPKVADDLTDGKGSVYYIPARIEVPVVFGSPEAEAALQSLDKMKAYEGEPQLLAPNIYENVLRLTAYTCYDELFSDNKIPDQDTLGRLLTAVKTAGEKSGVKVSFTQEEMDRINVNNHVILNGFGRQSDYSFVRGKCPVAVGLLKSIDSSILSFSAAEKEGVKLKSMGNLYIPAVLVGINASSPNQEYAEEFVRTILGQDVQDESLYDGFTVREDSLKMWMEDESKTEYSISMGSSNDDFTLEGKWPNRDQRDELTDIIQSADVPAVLDQQVLALIIDGSKNYLEGREDVETAVQAIENKLHLYTTEKE